MSAALVRAHGGSKDMVSTQRKGGLILANIIKDTMVNSPKAVHMRGLEGLVSQTTGVPRERPIMDGVITATVPSGMRDVPELHPVPASEQGKTDSKMGVGASFAGTKSGYGGGGGHAEKKKRTKK